MSLKKIVSILFFIASTVPFHLSALAQPVITGASGGLNNGSSLTITGTGFGAKSPAKPLLWAPFDVGLNPSSLGLRDTWDIIDNFAHSTKEGGIALGSIDNPPWAAAVILESGWNADRQKSYFFRRQRQNFVIEQESNQNYKIWRMWAPGHQLPDMYVAANNNSISVEGVNYVKYTEQHLNYPNVDTWRVEEFILQASEINQINGNLKIFFDNALKTNSPVMTRSSGYSGVMTINYVMHWVTANSETWNPPRPSNATVAVDDVYVDTTWSRVMVCEAPIFLNCRKLAIQIPSAWSNTSITVTINRGGISNSDFAYLYVFDANGLVNAVGHRLCSDCPASPTNLRVQ